MGLNMGKRAAIVAGWRVDGSVFSWCLDVFGVRVLKIIPGPYEQIVKLDSFDDLMATIRRRNG